MLLKNKWTGETNIVKVDEDYFNICKDDGEFVCLVTLKELNEGWEDYEEPKYFYCICTEGSINKYEVERYETETWVKHAKSIGNYFSSREEAEKAVECLRAWKRLKDRKFDFYGYQFHDILSGVLNIKAEFENDSDNQIVEDLDLLFSQEDD